MGPLEIIVVVLCAAIVIGVAAVAIVRKKQGKSSCGGDCSRCGGCSACGSAKKNEKK